MTRTFMSRVALASLFASAWWPTDRVRGTLQMRLLDPENHLVATSQPRKINFGKGEGARSSWEVPMPKEPGVYRVEVAVDSRILWREFVRVNP
jgi:hypothetical protein